MPATLQSPQTPNKVPSPPNINSVILGDLSVQPWYSSFYPREQLGPQKVDQLFVCQACFKYTEEVVKFVAHRKVCPLNEDGPVGEAIYEKDGYAIHKIDGEEHKLYTQNLSLFAKLFLDTKSVFFDVSSFLYYTLVSKADGPHGQVVGFFSKEKMSWDNNNVACILVFPPWQRKGLGQILMGASYELGRREGRFGGPERPLSALGKRAYVSFWCSELCRYLLQAPAKRAVELKAMSEALWILPEDVVTALKEMDVYEKRKTGSGRLVINKNKVRTWAETHGVSQDPPVDSEAFVAVSDQEMEEQVDDSDDAT